MKLARNLPAAVLAVLCLDAGASQYSDLWFNPAESGWGLGVVQQEETAFLTLFVYGPDGAPLWYVASDARVIAWSNPGGFPLFHGALYRTRGPWHGGGFDPAQVRAFAAGEVTLEVLGVDHARVHYTADGVTATKELTRQTFAAAVPAGAYAGQFSLRVSDGEGPPPELRRYPARIVMEFDGGIGYMRTDAAGQSCEYRGPFTQAGKVLRFSGTYACSEGPLAAGGFAVEGLEISRNGFTGSIRMTSGTVVQHGAFAGARY
ncbi:MAG TPA: hypothetical protein VFP44_22750 [Usitatibacter sp.]|nr:hypothetical protein [Usitatibacter sp.]